MKTNNSSKLAAVLLAGSVSGHAATWQKLAPLPAPNGGLICAEAGGKIIVLGGTNWETGEKKNWLKEVHQFDPDTLRWTTLATLQRPLAYAVGGTVGATFIVVGGSSGEAPFGGVIRVENGRVREQPAGGVSVPAVLSAGGVIGDEIVFTGGSDDAANIQGFGQTTSSWHTGTGVLRSRAPAPAPGMGTAASIVVGGELYVFGGVTWDPKTQAIANLAGAHVYSPQSDAWRTLASMPRAVRGQQAVALDERHLYIAGGFDDKGFTDEALVYDITTNRYQSAPPLPYKCGPHLLRSGKYIYCLGGEDRPKHRSDAAYRIKASELLPRN